MTPLAALLLASLASARHIPHQAPAARPRTVDALDVDATAEAQQRDDTATRALSNVRITTADGRCLFVDALAGDFRANLTPVQVGACGATDGQGWDVVTQGRHNDVAGTALVVSTLTNACFNFDPRRRAGNQVVLFSCGGRADGGGTVTPSQLFALNGTQDTAAGATVSFKPENAPGSCFAVKGDVVDIASCDPSDADQAFTFGAPAGAGASAPSASSSTTVFTSSSTTASTASSVPSVQITASPAASLATVAIPVPESAVPVSRGGVFSPSAAAEAQQRDDTATRAFAGVSIRAPDGRCLYADPTAGDFRLNLVPVGLVECAGTPNEQWDIVTAGAHNDVAGTALLVSALTQGCLSFDARRAANDTVTLFSCGGRADGTGATNAGQLVPFVGAFSFALAPSTEKGSVCILPGDDRLVSGSCPTDGAQLFSIVP